MKINKSLFIFTSLLVATLAGCGKTSITCTVRFDTKGGNSINDVIVKKGETIKSPRNPKRFDSNFDKWTYKGKEWDFVNDKVTCNMTLIANYKLITHNIEYNLHQ